MKNKQFKQLYKLLKTEKSHAGFTLMELLIGLVMSTVVIAGLGLGLYQLTKTTRDESFNITARNEASRTVEFISDELRSAQSIEVDNSIGPTGNLTNTTDGVAQDYTLPTNTTNGIPRLALQIPGVTQRVIYTVAKPNTNSTWKGPLVLYRWGPNLDNNGEYTDSDNTTNWVNEPLIDGLDDSTQTVSCGGVDEDYEGFFACIVDDDGDGIVEDGLTDTNGDGLVNLIDGDGIENDSIDDNDGLAITAQLYFTSEIDSDNIYTAETQAVARARVRDTDQAETEEETPLRFRTLAAEYSLGIRGGTASCNGSSSWTMRTDFINDPNLNNTNSYTPHTWIHDPERQGQPININTSDKLTIASIPIGYSSCTGTILSRGNENLDNTDTTHEKAGDGSVWTPKAGVESSDFTIDFSDPTTFNGNKESNSSYDNPDIGVDHVKVYKKGSTLADYDGYDDDTSDGNAGESSLGEFLASKGYAVLDGSTYRLVNDSDDLSTNPYLSTDPNAYPTLNILEDKERIIAVEIGQVQADGTSLITFPDGTDNPGFDMQDSVFILSTDKFDYDFPDGAF